MEQIGSQLWPITLLSLQVAAVAVLVSAIVGVPLGAWLGFSHFRGKRVVSALVYTGMALPPVVVGLVIYMLLSRSGPLGSLGWLFTPKAMILAQTILDLPFILGITMAAASAIPPELRFQVRCLGASERQARWTLLREARPGVILALATAFGRSMSEVGAVWMVGGNVQEHTRVLTTAIVLETGRGRFAVALALGAILLTAAFVVNLVILRFQGRALP